MSWRFRRVISAGALRLNISPRGAGWSVGIPGVRYGRSATGAPYVSLGFPGLACIGSNSSAQRRRWDAAS
jgi:hypothetical protein